MKNSTEAISSNVVVDYNDENNFSRKFLLTNTQILSLRKAFANNVKLDDVVNKYNNTYHNQNQIG